MNFSERDYRETEAETKKVLEFYHRHLTQLLNREYGDIPFTLSYTPTPKFYDYDAIWTLNGERKLHIEVKVRKGVYLRQYPQTKVPLRKHAVALFFNDSYGINTKYLCLFKDGLHSLNLHEMPDKVIDSPNRWDRGGQLCEYALYDIERFKRLNYETN